MAKHEELAWVPMCTTENGSWYWTTGLRDLQREARNCFVEHAGMEWEELRKEGWRIVRVRLTTELHQ
jgi:hypothetical protein